MMTNYERKSHWFNATDSYFIYNMHVYEVWTINARHSSLEFWITIIQRRGEYSSNSQPRLQINWYLLLKCHVRNCKTNTTNWKLFFSSNHKYFGSLSGSQHSYSFSFLGAFTFCMGEKFSTTSIDSVPYCSCIVLKLLLLHLCVLTTLYDCHSTEDQNHVKSAEQ